MHAETIFSAVFLTSSDLQAVVNLFSSAQLIRCCSCIDYAAHHL